MPFKQVRVSPVLDLDAYADDDILFALTENCVATQPMKAVQVCPVAARSTTFLDTGLIMQVFIDCKNRSYYNLNLLN